MTEPIPKIDPLWPYRIALGMIDYIYLKIYIIYIIIKIYWLKISDIEFKKSDMLAPVFFFILALIPQYYIS